VTYDASSDALAFRRVADSIQVGKVRQKLDGGTDRFLKARSGRALKTRPDGTMVDGHHRIKILRERGVDVDYLPREIVPKA
jgi:hypothetical protein